VAQVVEADVLGDAGGLAVALEHPRAVLRVAGVGIPEREVVVAAVDADAVQLIERTGEAHREQGAAARPLRLRFAVFVGAADADLLHEPVDVAPPAERAGRPAARQSSRP
jgi:hypothetical protein